MTGLELAVQIAWGAAAAVVAFLLLGVAAEELRLRKIWRKDKEWQKKRNDASKKPTSRPTSNSNGPVPPRKKGRK